MAICTIDNRVVSRWINTGMPVSSGSMSYTEPIQGCVNDCFFNAALSAVAWAASSKLKIFPNYQFYDPASSKWIPLQTGIELAVDAGNNLVYARTSTGYIWPCLYEKAYAKWKSGNEPPDIKTIFQNGGNPLTALQNICGGTLKQKQLTFLRTGITMYPTVAYTNHNPGGGLTPDHSYTVTRKSGTGYELRNPCSGGLIWINGAIDATNFFDWGYVIPG